MSRLPQGEGDEGKAGKTERHLLDKQPQEYKEVAIVVVSLLQQEIAICK